MASFMAGIGLALVCVVLFVRLVWWEELDELVFAFVAMFLFASLVLMRVGAISDTNKTDLNGAQRTRSRGSADNVQHSKESAGKSD